MKYTSRDLFTILVACALGVGCADRPTADEQTKDTSSMQALEATEAAVACDPIVEEYRNLMADHEAGLKEMVAAKKVDKVFQERWSMKAEAISKKLNERGEKEIGIRCWNEFNTIGQTYTPRIAKLSMELAMIEAGGKMDPAALEAMKKAMGQ